jgi:hypothetical protein
MSAHTDVGKYGEVWVARVLARVGHVQMGGPADLEFEGVALEIKTARLSIINGHGARGYQFCLRRDGGKTDYRKADVLILIALNQVCQPKAVFVIPVDDIDENKKITMPPDLSSEWAPYLDRWDLLADACCVGEC